MDIFNAVLVTLTIIVSMYSVNKSSIQITGYMKAINYFLGVVLLSLTANQYVLETPVINKELGQTLLWVSIFSIVLLRAICINKSKKQSGS